MDSERSACLIWTRLASWKARAWRRAKLFGNRKLMPRPSQGFALRQRASFPASSPLKVLYISFEIPIKVMRVHSNAVYFIVQRGFPFERREFHDAGE